MMGKLLLASLVSALIFFAWGFLFWGLGGGMGSMSTVPNSEAVTSVLRDNITESGTYYYPLYDGENPNGMEQFESQLTAGPVYMLHYHADGVPTMDFSVFLFGFVQLFVSSFILCLLMNMVIGSLPTYGKRLSFIFLGGLFASTSICLTTAIWLHTSWSFALTNLAYYPIGWLLSGLAIAKMVRPRTPATV